MSKKITITLSDELAAKVQVVGDQFNIGRSGAVSVLLSEAFMVRENVALWKESVKQQKEKLFQDGVSEVME